MAEFPQQQMETGRWHKGRIISHLEIGRWCEDRVLRILEIGRWGESRVFNNLEIGKRYKGSKLEICSWCEDSVFLSTGNWWQEGRNYVNFGFSNAFFDAGSQTNFALGKEIFFL